MAIKLAVVIVNYNAGDCLAACLDSVLSNPRVHQVVVVDNASRDDSLRAVEARLQTDPVRLRLIRQPANSGFAAAANHGAAACQADALLFLNPDAELQADTLDRAVEAMDAGVGMVGAWVVDRQGREQRGTRRRLPTVAKAAITFLGLGFLERWIPACRSINLGWQDMPVGNTRVEAVSGAFMLLPRTAFDAVGGFDSGYFLHCEDLDLMWRLRAAGYGIVLAAEAVVRHIQGVPSRSAPFMVHYHKHRSMARYLRRHGLAQGHKMLLAALLGLLWLRFALTLPSVWVARSRK